jgi:hypothetical protein
VEPAATRRPHGTARRTEEQVAKVMHVDARQTRGRLGIARLDAAQDLTVMRMQDFQHFWRQDWTRCQAVAQGPLGQGREDQIAALRVECAVELDLETHPLPAAARLDGLAERVQGRAGDVQDAVGRGRGASHRVCLKDARELEGI